MCKKQLERIRAYSLVFVIIRILQRNRQQNITIYIYLRGREIYYRNRLPGLWRPEVSQSDVCKLENQEYDCAIH